MPVDVKGTIKFNPEAEQEYTIACPQLGITEEGSGTIEEDIEDLRERVTKAISEEFHVAPESVQITGYTMSLNFEVTGPVNHTLDKFSEEPGGDNRESAARSREGAGNHLHTAKIGIRTVLLRRSAIIS
jgi:hypothetical protein